MNGNAGLSRAVDRFDPARGRRFSTYAKYWIMDAIQRAIKNKARAVRVPMSHQEIAAKYRRIKHDVEEQTGEKATVTDVARRIHQKGTAKRIRRALDTLSVDTYELVENGSAAVEPRGTDEQIIDAEARDKRFEHLNRLDDAIATLDEREARIVWLRFGIGTKSGTGLTFGAIGRKLRISADWARRLHERALEKLYAALAK